MPKLLPWLKAKARRKGGGGAGAGQPGGGGGNAGGVHFVPTDLGTSVLIAWHDASDASSITDAGGGAVSTWNDKSGNGNHVTEATNRPTTGTGTLNGMNTIDFDGTNDILQRTSSLTNFGATGTTGHILVAVAMHDSSTHGGIVRVVCDGASSGDAAQLTRDSGNMGCYGDRTNNSTSTAATYSDSDNTNWHVKSGFNFSTERAIFLDGNHQSTNLGNVGTAAVTTYQIGVGLSRDRTTSRFMNGRIAEVFCVAGGLVGGATGDTWYRQKLEGYAAWKWGLQGNLDAWHPYQNGPPRTPNKGAPFTATYVGSTADTSNQTTYTFTSHALGSGGSTNPVICGFVWQGASTDATSVTIDGVTARFLARNAAGNGRSEWWIAYGVTNSSGNIVINTGGANSRCAVAVWRGSGKAVLRYSNGTNMATAANGSNVTVTTEDGGAVLCIGCHDTSTASSGISFRNLTSRQASAAFESNGVYAAGDMVPDATSESVGMDLNTSGTGSANAVFCAISLGAKSPT